MYVRTYATGRQNPTQVVARPFRWLLSHFLLRNYCIEHFCYILEKKRFPAVKRASKSKTMFGAKKNSTLSAFHTRKGSRRRRRRSQINDFTYFKRSPESAFFCGLKGGGQLSRCSRERRKKKSRE